ncbi:hypothetical protein [Amycolatopsis sp. NPDC050768]|uniref:hypothetical protein n=1 Tax=Amycolatopsis sp. NPDC050768 TaxID=3154839 RepID=UPI0034013CE4
MRNRKLTPAPPAWQALIDEWSTSLESENKSPRTNRCYTDIARKFHLWVTDPVAPPDVEKPETWLASVPPEPETPDDYVPNQKPPITPIELMKKVLKQFENSDFVSRRDEAIIRIISDT